MQKPRGTVVPLLRGDVPSVLRRLHRLEQPGMIALFDPEERVQSVGLQRLDVRGLGTQAVFGHKAFYVGGA